MGRNYEGSLTFNFSGLLRFIMTAIVLTVIALAAMIFLGVPFAHAEVAGVAPAPVPEDYTFMGQVLALFKDWGGMEASVKVSMVITLIISSIKVSYFRKFWDSLKIKVGGKEISLQILVVPLLSVVIGLVTQGKWSVEAIIAYCIMGGGAVYIHEIMDVVKSIPVVSPVLKVIIDVISFILGGKKSS